MLYFTAISMSTGAVIMLCVIVYALTADISTVNENRIILDGIKEHFGKLNSRHAGHLLWEVSDDLLWYSIRRLDMAAEENLDKSGDSDSK